MEVAHTERLARQPEFGLGQARTAALRPQAHIEQLLNSGICQQPEHFKGLPLLVSDREHTRTAGHRVTSSRSPTASEGNANATFALAHKSRDSSTSARRISLVLSHLAPPFRGQ